MSLSAPLAKNVCGIELQKYFSDALNNEGISCYQIVEQLSNGQDSILFHCLEHLPDPIKPLKDLHKTLKQEGKGKIVIAAPHARVLLFG